MPDSSNKGGRKPRVTDEDLLDEFRATSDPVLSTAEVADAVPIKRRGTLNRLRDLEDAGTLDSKQIGGRNTVWWLAEDAGRSRPTPDQPPANSDAVEGEVRGSVDNSLADDHTDEDGAEDDDALAAAIARVDTPGSGKNREKREQALRDAYEYLAEHGQAQRSDFKDLLGDEVGYSGGFRSWWTNYVKAKDALKQLPDVDAPAEGEHTWYYTGDDVQLDSGIYDPTEEF